MPPTPKTPEQLLHRCLAEAVRRSCPGWLRTQADDISQSARLCLVRHAHREASGPLTSAYVRRTARHAVIDTVRRRQRREALWSSYVPVATREPALDPERLLLARELADAVREGLSQLPDARREAVGLYLEGHGVSEIAERLGCPRKRVDNLVYRGLSTLRRALEDRGMGRQAA